MDEALSQETRKLVRAWAQYDAPFLGDYLVADVEDPRINVQSILSRHFLLASLFGNRFEQLMLEELRFAVAMNWLTRLARESGAAPERRVVLHALRCDADNAEGLAIPHFLRTIFASLPTSVGESAIPNYILEFLATPTEPGAAKGSGTVLDTFLERWRAVLARESPERVSVLEPACGSANDYRFLEAYGIARLIDYTGFDLCERNIANALALFPHARFQAGNAFEIPGPDQGFELCFVHDLLEHLSLAGLDQTIKELCRVTRRGMCIGFFQMDEIPEHRVRPVGEYHLNTLSLETTKAVFARHGFSVQPLHIGSYLRWRTGCNETHNPNAYTFLAFRR